MDRSSLSSAACRCSVAVELVASGAAVEHMARPARTVLTLDVSASMKGEPLAHLVRSVDRILDALEERSTEVPDEIGVVTFADEPLRVLEPVPVDAKGKRLVRACVGRLVAEGGTNIEGGLESAAAMLASAPSGWRRGVVLLSDGAPNVGAHTADGLREVVRRHRPDVSFFALGYGADHAEDVLSSIGESGGGGYEYVADPAACARAFARALGAQGDAVASGIELVIAPADGVELVRFVGREETRFSREGVIVPLADMVNGGRRLVVAELAVQEPGSGRFVVDLLRVTARWRSAASSAVESSTRAVTIEVADGEPTPVSDALARILLLRADEARESARAQADLGSFGGAAATLRAIMKEIERCPGWARGEGTDLAEAYELLLDEAMAFERRPSLEAYAAMRKAAVSSRLAVNVPSAARLRGDESQRLMAHVAGDCPEAWLVDVSEGTRYALREECIVGRTQDADIRIEAGDVARRQAEIFADQGAFWIADLGSLNPTKVNGAVLGWSPHKLAVGDVVMIGEVELRYEEGAPPEGET